MFKKAYNYLGKIRGLILIIYLTLILTISVFNKQYKNMSSVYLSFFIFLIISIVICPIIIKIANKISIKQNDKNTNYKKWFIILSLILLITFIILFLIHYPGFYCEDTFDQYEQALMNEYNDWHPIAQTLFAIKLPLLFTKNNWIGAIAIFQFILFALTISYMITTILKYTNKKIALICFLFILLNPNTQIASYVVVKDVTYTIGTILLMSYTMNIYFTKGKWLEKKRNIIIFIIVLVLTTLFRHNSILFTGPLLIAILFLIDRKKWLKITIITCIAIFLIKGPIYQKMDIEKTELRISETLGIPMNIIATVYKYDKNNMNEEVLNFYSKTAPTWVFDQYNFGDFNIIKGTNAKDYNPYIVDQNGYIETAKLTIKTFISSPKYSLLGITRTTYPVYTIIENYTNLLNESLGAHDERYKTYGLRQHGVSKPEINYQETIKKIINIIPFFKYIGLMNLLVIIGILVQKNYKKILLALPMLTFNYGTMMLLYTHFDSIRYFLYSFMITPIILVILFKEEDKIYK